MIKFLYSKVALIFVFSICLPFNVAGFSYHHFSVRYFTPIHVLVVNPKEHLIIPVKALGKEVPRETVATIANRHGAVAAVNGGFWKLNGKPAGALKIKNQWFGTPNKPRGAIGWSLINQTVLIDKILTNYSLKKCPSEDQIKVIPFSNSSYATSKEWNEFEYIVGGSPVLIQAGHLIKDFSPEQNLQSFLVNRHARTAVGIKDNGDWVFVVVDSSFYRLFGGMTIRELAQLMLDLGCVEALNLDGGGSSTMVIRGKVVNNPNNPFSKNREEGKCVEAVSDAILIF